MTAVKEAPEIYKEDNSDIEEYELELQEEEWAARGNKTEEQLVNHYEEEEY